MAAGEGYGVNASPAGPRRWPGGRDKEEEEEEVSRLRAGEPRGPAGEAGSAAPPLSGARLAGPRGAEFPEERRRRRRRGRGEQGEGGAEGREGGALPGRKRCTSLLPLVLRPKRGTLQFYTLAICLFHFLGFCTSCLPASRVLECRCLCRWRGPGFARHPRPGGQVPGVYRSRRRGFLVHHGTARPMVPRACALSPS